MVDCMSLETGLPAIICQACGYLALRVATVLGAAGLAIEHMAQAGHEVDSILISPLRREVVR
jgi:hypothetical protein